ncbi:hypothetical protein FE783_11535 [Paenibacillus mesophilus]|uniref:hypothetical protein n=1 Tax=Paenibacillus mesophilus TaxID=2582849 RepID=UPI00110D8E43|nr:hypothetical protein [Paenibacillus mesophilus]TMV50185.1 hypothetical protein FE783_11535 [Paenibacillus mesophilus]
MKEKKKIYILLTDTGTWLSRMIKAYTKEPFNHASLAFDEDLHEVYSFGRKYESNPFLGGFVKENLLSPLFLDDKRETTCAVYCCEVGKAAYERIRHTVKELELREDDYKYNALGLLGVALNFKLKRKNAYFCSQFVSEMFLAGGVALTGKCPEFTTPGDLVKSRHASLLYTGSLRNYQPLARRFESVEVVRDGLTVQSS